MVPLPGVIGLYTYTFVSLLSHWPQATLFTNQSQLGAGTLSLFQADVRLPCDFSISIFPVTQHQNQFTTIHHFSSIKKAFSLSHTLNSYNSYVNYKVRYTLTTSSPSIFFNLVHYFFKAYKSFIIINALKLNILRVLKSQNSF